MQADVLPRLETFAQRLVKLLPPGASILEIGSGEGQLAQSLAEGGFRVTAIDREQRSSFPTLVTDFEKYDAGNARFDCVAACLVLHHVTDLANTLGKIRALLKLDGLIAVDDYGWERLGEVAARQRWGAAWQAELQAWCADRKSLHQSDVMLEAFDRYFARVSYHDHAYFDDGLGEDRIAFTYFGRPRPIPQMAARTGFKASQVSSSSAGMG